MAMLTLESSVQKCATCKRWTGRREHCAQGRQVSFETEQHDGQCIGGPWDGNVRDPLTRCGRWVQWASVEWSPHE